MMIISFFSILLSLLFYVINAKNLFLQGKRQLSSCYEFNSNHPPVLLFYYSIVPSFSLLLFLSSSSLPFHTHGIFTVIYLEHWYYKDNKLIIKMKAQFGTHSDTSVVQQCC